MSRLHRSALVGLALALGHGPAHAQPSSADSAPIAIVGAIVLTEPGKALANATVLIRGGAVAAVGPQVRIPGNAQRIDARGQVITAGLVEASSTLGLSEVAQVSSTVEGSFGSGHGGVHAAYRVTDGYNPASVAIPVARAGGVTSAVATPRGGLVAGTSAWFSLADGKVERLTVAAPLAMYANLGAGALGSAEGSRGVAVEKLRELLDDAVHLGKRRRDYDRNRSRELAAAKLDLEALLPVARGRLPLVVRAHKSSDIRAALRLAREHGLRIIIEGGTEAWMVAEELRAARVPVILDPTANLPTSFDRIHVRDDLARVLAEAGVEIAISGLGSSTGAGNLRQLAGIAVQHGLPHDAALAAVTTGPAEIFGLKRRGKIAPGAPADLVIWSGDPFELSSHAVRVFIGGVDQNLRTRQTLLLERYRKLPAAQ